MTLELRAARMKAVRPEIEPVASLAPTGGQATNTWPAFEHADRVPGEAQIMGSSQAGEAGAEDDDVHGHGRA